MARMRYIKPGFFLNDELAEINPLGRILFEGLWCYADREGKLEDRPKRLKMEILPYDNCDINKYLEELKKREFIIRYSINGNNYIKIKNWNKHQSPHVKEQDSIIPEPDKNNVNIIQTQDKNNASTPLTITDTDTDTDTSNLDLTPFLSISLKFHCKQKEDGLSHQDFKNELSVKSKIVISGAETLEKLHRIEKESIDNIKKVLRFILKDTGYEDWGGWKPNVVSLSSLRRKKDGEIKYFKIKNSMTHKKSKTYTYDQMGVAIAQRGYKWEDFEEIEKDKWILKNK